MRFPFKTLATALLLLVTTSAANAADIDDCRTREKIPEETRLKACNAVIDSKTATSADAAYAHYKRAMLGSANPKADQEQVMADVSKAIELDPQMMEAYAFRALGYNRAMQYDKAIADLSKAIEIKPDRWGLYSLRAMVETQKKDTKAAIADFKAALALDPPASSAEMIRQKLAKLEQEATP